MNTVSISKFKATCLALLDRVKRTGKPIVVTRRGEPIAEIVPVRRAAEHRSWLGAFEGTGRILGDVVSPAVPAADWETLGR